MQHVIAIETYEQRGLFGRRIKYYYATCVCDFVGPIRKSIIQARQDASNHLDRVESIDMIKAAQAAFENRRASETRTTEKESKPMNGFIETTALQIVGFIVTANAQQIGPAIDTLADRIITAVKDSETQLDDAAADLIASALARAADRIRAGLAHTEIPQA